MVCNVYTLIVQVTYTSRGEKLNVIVLYQLQVNICYSYRLHSRGWPFFLLLFP